MTEKLNNFTDFGRAASISGKAPKTNHICAQTNWFDKIQPDGMSSLPHLPVWTDMHAESEGEETES